jgi:hypothetical protein
MVAIFPASTNGGGTCLGAPDVCKTPAPPPPVGPGQIPVPYPNNGMLNQATGGSTKVKIVQKQALTIKAKIPKSMGDEAGTLGGIVSGMNMGEIQFKKGSSMVKVEGSPIVHLTSVTSHNGTNANMPAGAQIAPSQTKVIVAP